VALTALFIYGEDPAAGWVISYTGAMGVFNYEIFVQDLFIRTGHVTTLDGAIEDLALDDSHKLLAVVGLGRLVMYAINPNSESETVPLYASRFTTLIPRSASHPDHL
jgi:hypothetical protein